MSSFLCFSCGKQSSSHTDIIGGDILFENDTTYFAGLFIEDPNKIYCGATFIKSDILVTAAHCVAAKNFPLNVKLFLKETEKHKTLSVPAIAISIHPNFTSPAKGYDIALIKVKLTKDQAKDVSYIKYNSDASLFGDFWLDSLTAYGVGNTTSIGEIFEKEIRTVDLPIVATQECKSLYPTAKIDGDIICAGYIIKGGKDTCRGDSGGPLISQNLNSGPMIVGITSWGQGCGQKNKAGVYTRISSYEQWIENTIERWALKSEIDESNISDLQAEFCYLDHRLASISQNLHVKESIDYRFTISDNFKLSNEFFSATDSVSSCNYALGESSIVDSRILHDKQRGYLNVVNHKNQQWIAPVEKKIKSITIECADSLDFHLNHFIQYGNLKVGDESFIIGKELNQHLRTENLFQISCQGENLKSELLVDYGNLHPQFYLKLSGKSLNEIGEKVWQLHKTNDLIDFKVTLDLNEIEKTLTIQNLFFQDLYTWEISCNFPFILEDAYLQQYISQLDHNGRYNFRFIHPSNHLAYIKAQSYLRLNLHVYNNSSLNSSSRCLINNSPTEFKIHEGA